MTLTDFRTRVRSFLAVQGESWFSDADDALLAAEVSIQLRVFSALTWCLRDQAGVLTVVNGTSLYDLQGSAMAPDYAKCLQVRIPDGTVLRNYEDRPGPVRPEEAAMWGSASGTPLRWAEIGEKKIRLYPTPNAGGSYAIDGFRLHAPVSSGSDVIELADEWIDGAVMWVAARISRPRGAGWSLDQMLRQEQWARSEMQIQARLYGGYEGLVPPILQGIPTPEAA